MTLKPEVPDLTNKLGASIYTVPIGGIATTTHLNAIYATSTTTYAPGDFTNSTGKTLIINGMEFHVRDDESIEAIKYRYLPTENNESFDPFKGFKN